MQKRRGFPLRLMLLPFVSDRLFCYDIAVNIVYRGIGSRTVIAILIYIAAV